MKCPFCNHPKTEVKESRPKTQDTVIRRRRACLGCGQKFTTYERYETVEVKEETLAEIKEELLYAILRETVEKIVKHEKTA